MADDPYVRWQQSVPFGVYRDGNWVPDDEGPWSAWHAGRVKDMLQFPDGSVLIAAEHGGVWGVQPNGEAALCLTDSISAHQFNRIALGPDGQGHAFAGGESLWVTDPSAILPMLTWKQIASFVYGTVWDILVLDRRIIVAAEGIWWADIPAATPQASSQYVWKQALLETSSGRVPTSAFYSLAEGRSVLQVTGAIRYRTIIAGSAGMAGQQGIFLGSWQGADLVFRGPSQILLNGRDATDQFRNTGNIAVASCAGNKDRAYAAADRNDALTLLLRTADGGKTWTSCGSAVPLDTTTGDLFSKSSHQAGHQTLHVFADNADIVSFGWFESYISFDGGDTWEAPGCNDGFIYQDSHQHIDTHRVVLLKRPDAPWPTPCRSLLVGSDGGANRITWGQGASCIEGQHLSDGDHGDLEAVVLEGNHLVHYRRSSDTLKWGSVGVVTSKATDRACMIQGDFGNEIKNLELVVPEGSDLVHYFYDVDAGTWKRAQVVASGVTGPACLIQGNYPKGAEHGNFEVVALEGSNLVHYMHDNGDVRNPWQPVVTITSHAASGACMIQSDYPKNADHGNFELVVLEDEGGVFGRALVHYWRDNGGDERWKGPTLITTDATATAWLIQADYPRNVDHHNFELFVQQGQDLWHWIRDNQANGNPWYPVTRINAPGEKIDGPPVAFQGNYGTDDHHGNFELLASFGGRVFHYYRDAADAHLSWHRSAQVSRYAFNYFSRWNWRTPTLLCNRFIATELDHGQLGVSQALDGLIATGTQDNGVIIAFTGDNGTPWVSVGLYDGNEAVWPASTSPEFAHLKSGDLLVWYHDAEGAAPHGSLGDPNGQIKGAIPEILPLTVSDPTVNPPPDGKLGLVGDPRMGRVVAPAYVDHSLVLALLGAPAVAKDSSRAAIYGLFVDGPLESERLQRQPPKAEWRFLAAVDVSKVTDDRAWQIRAMGSFDGSTVMLAAEVGANQRRAGDHTELLLLDVQSATTTWMSTDPKVGFPGVNWIVPVGPREAYAATDNGRVLAWDGQKWRFPGQAVPGSDELLGMAADPSTQPTTIFVITANTVYVSRDGTKTWMRAMNGLPKSLELSNIHLMIDHKGTAQLHLSTYGRSTWVAGGLRP